MDPPCSISTRVFKIPQNTPHQHHATSHSHRNISYGRDLRCGHWQEFDESQQIWFKVKTHIGSTMKTYYDDIQVNRPRCQPRLLL